MLGELTVQLVANPSREQREKSDLEFIVAGTKEAIVMVEGGAEFVPESEVLDALYFGHEQIKSLIALQEELREQVGKPKGEVELDTIDEELGQKVESLVGQDLAPALTTVDKLERRDALSALEESVLEKLSVEIGEEAFEEKKKEAKHIFHELVKKFLRGKILDEGVRIDGRGLKDVRDIECEVGIIPRAHGSALFTRGETQAIVTTTLGTSSDAQRIDTLTEQTEKNFMLHYNFPPYSVGEAKMLRGASRREVGHGALALRALESSIPGGDEFPYVVRIVSEITESNGSSSMASVCGGSLSMMDAGIQLPQAVGGVAMGLVKEGEKVAVLTDILGDEDHFGDMDFKVCGTSEGVTALQMDIKCTGLSRSTMEQALEQAREARVHILEKMNEALSEARSEFNQYAPVIESIKINPDKIRDVIGPGGKTIRSIIESTGAKIDVENDGTIFVASSDRAASKQAIEIIMGLTEEAEIGKKYSGIVKRTTDFGAFVEILPGVEGLVHISQLAPERVENVTDILREGDEVNVKVLDIDRMGRIRLSRKEALADA